jgi:hypothetical protein
MESRIEDGKITMAYDVKIFVEPSIWQQKYAQSNRGHVLCRDLCEKSLIAVFILLLNSFMNIHFPIYNFYSI